MVDPLHKAAIGVTATTRTGQACLAILQPLVVDRRRAYGLGMRESVRA